MTPGGKPRIAIIGGGLSGVVAAYELAVRHPELAFTLFEASNRLGGIIETVHENGFTIECGPDSWVTEKPWARELAEELGLSDEIVPSNDERRVTYIAKGRVLVPVPDGMRMMVPTRWEPLLHSPLLSWEARLAYLREPKRAEELKQASLEKRGADTDESIADFVRRHFGEEVTKTLAGPLLSGVFGGDVERLSVRAVMAPFVKMEAEQGSLIDALRLRATAFPQGQKPAIFTSLRSGLETLIGKMVERLPAAAVLLNTPVTSVAQTSAGWQVSSGQRETNRFDAVLLATPAHVTRTLLSSTGHAAAVEAAALLPVEASSSIVVALGFQAEKASRLRMPRGFGFLVPQGTKTASESLLACTFVDQKFAHRALPGGVLLRGFFGGAAAEQLAGESDAELAQRTREQLSRLLGPLPEADVSVVRRWPQSLPQYFVGHLPRMAWMEKLVDRLQTLFLVGNAYHGVGLPDLVRDARTAVQSVVESVGQTTGTNGF
jgi:oxygen-dependent protoporphyrinogen oxidase